MPGTAVIISGVPATILPGVLRRLAVDFPEGYVIRGRGSRLRAAKTPDYDKAAVGAALAQAAEAVFGSSRRPLSFCRNPQRKCASKNQRGQTCGRKEGESCPLERPSRLILAYQESANEHALLKAFYHSAWTCRLPSTVYDDEKATARLVAEQMRAAKGRLHLVEEQLTRMNSPLLLPPKAFKSSGAVAKLIKDVNAGEDPRPASAQFRKSFWKRDGRHYVSDNGLTFKAEEKHGIAGALDDPSFALGAIYRLGCEIALGFHWNVSALDGSALGGRWTLECRQTGVQKPAGTHVNMFADDRFR